MHFGVNFFSDCISLKAKSKVDKTRCHHSLLQSFISGITNLRYECESKVNIIPLYIWLPSRHPDSKLALKKTLQTSIITDAFCWDSCTKM